MTEPLHLAIIMDGAGPGRELARGLADQACGRADLDIDLIDLAVACVPAVSMPGAVPTPAAVTDLAPWLADADAFVVVAPAGSLPTAAGWFAEQWQAKPVALAGRAAAVQDLRLAFMELHVVIAPHVITTCGSGRAELTFDQLIWWGRALRQARADHPYPFPGKE